MINILSQVLVMAIRLYNYEGFPLFEFEKLKVYRKGSFQVVTTPAVGDLFNIETTGERATYSVFKVNGWDATIMRIASHVKYKNNQPNQSFS